MNLQANCLAIHEFGKDLEGQVGKLQYLAVLVFSAYASGLLMVVTNRPVGAEAFLPVGASGAAIHAAALFFLAAMVFQGLWSLFALMTSFQPVYFVMVVLVFMQC